MKRAAAVMQLEAGPPARAMALPVRFELDQVYAEHAGFVFRVLRGMGVNEHLVADAVQDVFVVVHRRLPEFDGGAALRTWLFEIAYRVARDYRRKAQRAHSHEPLPAELRDAGPGPAEHAERNAALRLLHALLDQLDDDKRAVLVLAEIEGLTAPEIAEITGVPLNTVYTRLRRARLALSSALAAHERSP